MAGPALRERFSGLMARKAAPSEQEAHLRAIKAHLHAATRGAPGVDVPQDPLEAVVQACSSADDRRVIMQYIHGCLAESQSSQWRCVYLGLQVLQELLKRGPPELMEETVAGAHFDMVHRLSFLEKYEYGLDKRVQGLIQKRSRALRTYWQERQLKEDAAVVEDTVARSPPVEPNAASPSAADVMDLLDARSSGSESSPALAPPTSKAADMLGMQDDDSTTDGELSEATPAAAQVASGRPAPPLVDLLGGFDNTPATPDTDWLAVAQEHGLYATGKPCAGDLPAPRVQTQGPVVQDLLDF